MKQTEQKIIEIIDKLKPFLISDGGNIEYIKFENGIVYVRLLGACSHCHMMEYTLKDGIEQAIMCEVPEVIEVKNVM